MIDGLAKALRAGQTVPGCTSARDQIDSGFTVVVWTSLGQTNGPVD